MKQIADRLMSNAFAGGSNKQRKAFGEGKEVITARRFVVHIGDMTVEYHHQDEGADPPEGLP